MRDAFVKTLTSLAESDPRILLLTGDLGYTVLEYFAEKFPERFFNVGVAEQNMVGLATGLAEAGFIPFIYSISTFASLRPYEFIRNGPILHKLQVRIIGVGGGFDYGSAGHTHHALEDVGIMRLQPGIAVVVPADYLQAKAALLSTWNLAGPIYYQIGKDEKAVISGLEGRFELGRAQLVGEGGDILIITMGGITKEVVLAVESLLARGISATMMVIACVNPAPVNDLIEALSRFSTAITVEAHYIVGGLGSLVAEVIAENGLHCQLIRCGVKGSPGCVSGSQSFLNRKHELSSEAISDVVLKSLSKNKAKRWTNA